MSKEWIQAKASEVKFAMEVGRDPTTARLKLLNMVQDLGGDRLIAARMGPPELSLYLLVLLLALP